MTNAIIRRATLAHSTPKAEASKPEPAMLWINVGYTVTGPDGTPKFVSLPLGIPLDQCRPVKTNSSNEDWSMFQQARNDLLEQLVEFGLSLPKGEPAPIDLEVQIRHVSSEADVAPVSPDANPYTRKFA